MRGAYPVFVVSFLLPLVACSASQCDPSQADLFSGVGCEVSGAYTQRHQAQMAELQSANTSDTEAQIADENAQQNAAVAKTELAQRRSQLHVLEGETASLKERVQAAQATHAISSGALRQANDQLAALRRLQAVNVNDPSTAQLVAIRDRQAKLANILTSMGQ
jgi:hypothetical protein